MIIEHSCWSCRLISAADYWEARFPVGRCLLLLLLLPPLPLPPLVQRRPLRLGRAIGEI